MSRGGLIKYENKAVQLEGSVFRGIILKALIARVCCSFQCLLHYNVRSQGCFIMAVQISSSNSFY